ncbi:MAG: hybrid sensor histidine kinase/response regulator [Fusobacterium sp.]
MFYKLKDPKEVVEEFFKDYFKKRKEKEAISWFYEDLKYIGSNPNEICENKKTLIEIFKEDISSFPSSLNISIEELLETKLTEDMSLINSSIILYRENENFKVNVRYSIFCKDDGNGYKIFSAHCSFPDSSKKHMEKELSEISKELRLNEIILKNSLKESNIYFWEYDIENDVFIPSYRLTNKFNFPEKIVNGIESLIKSNIIHRDGIKDFIKIHEDLKKGEKNITKAIKFFYDDNIQWREIKYEIVESQYGKNLRALGISRNINKEKSLENLMGSLLYSEFDFIVKINSKNKQYSIYTDKDYINDIKIKDGKNIEKLFQYFLENYVKEDNKIRVSEHFNFNYIVENLSKKKEIVFYYEGYGNNKNIKIKKIKALSLNSSSNIFYVIRTDVTEIYEKQKDNIEALELALKSAEAAKISETNFLSKISHEIRTPINVIIGMSEIALNEIDYKGKEEIKSYLTKMQSSSDYLLSLINDVLKISKIQSGKLVLDKKLINMNKFFQDINLMYEVQAKNKNITYEFVKKEGVKEFYIGDEIRLKQVLINIISNAIKFTDVLGKVKISCEEISEKNGFSRLLIVVEDTGRGISKDFIEHIFEPFSQEGFGISSKYGGSGLGLAISKNIVDLMDGNIKIESKKNVGTKFKIQVMLKSKNLENKNIINKNTKINNKNKDIIFNGEKILVAEDHELNIEVMKKLLKYKGLQVEIARNGLEAVQRFQLFSREYSAILMDIRMPVMNGLEAAKRIRQLNRENSKTIPIIAVTAGVFQNEKEDVLKAGMNDILEKPIIKEDLYSIIYKYIYEK